MRRWTNKVQQIEKNKIANNKLHYLYSSLNPYENTMSEYSSNMVSCTWVHRIQSPLIIRFLKLVGFKKSTKNWKQRNKNKRHKSSKCNHVPLYNDLLLLLLASHGPIIECLVDEIQWELNTPVACPISTPENQQIFPIDQGFEYWYYDRKNWTVTTCINGTVVLLNRNRCSPYGSLNLSAHSS